MMDDNWLTSFLFSRIRATQPDGRALYAYRCSEKKYIELKALIQKEIISACKNSHTSLQFPALFCLYAAETFCREHSEGAWAWETVFRPLGKVLPIVKTKISRN
jgi:hypothetical protein